MKIHLRKRIEKVKKIRRRRINRFCEFSFADFVFDYLWTPELYNSIREYMRCSRFKNE